MSYTKTEIYNLALSALLLTREVSNADAETTNNEVRVLNTHWKTAFEFTLQDLDLDSLSQPIPLELIVKPEDHIWNYIYKYPSNCLFFRRIESGAIIDTNRTHIAKRTGLYEGQKAIFTNEPNAIGECIPKDAPLEALSPMAAMTIAYHLAFISAPLIVGKGAKRLRDQIYQNFLISKQAAQEIDRLENSNYDPAHLRSEFVAARLE